MWWRPKQISQWKLDPKWKMTSVELPDYTEECNEKRPTMEEKCSAKESDRWGSLNPINVSGRVGAGCANPTELLKKMFSSGLRKQTMAYSPTGVPTPGLSFLQRFQVDQADVEEMLFRWRYGHPQLEAGSNPLWARRVVCEIARNISERMKTNLPTGYVKNTRRLNFLPPPPPPPLSPHCAPTHTLFISFSSIILTRVSLLLVPVMKFSKMSKI